MDQDWQAVIDGTWPAEQVVQRDGWTLRITPGAGSRVNALSGGTSVAAAEALAAEHGSSPNFVVWPHQAKLDQELLDLGYVIRDAVHLWQADAAELAGAPLPHATAFPVWPPLEIMRRIWEAGGIGTGRQAVMARAPIGTGLLGRAGDRAAGVAFVSLTGRIAMLHALEVIPRFRRKGVGLQILRAAAHWTRAQGGDTLSLIVTRDNPANALYAASGMTQAPGYHYRRRPEPE